MTSRTEYVKNVAVFSRGSETSIAVRFFAFALVAALILSAVAVARAQDAEMDTIVVEGRILRPQAAYIIQRASIEFGIEAKKRSFVGKVVESVNKEPFLP